VPVDALGVFTPQRAIENFPLSGRPVQRDWSTPTGPSVACARPTTSWAGGKREKFRAIETACEEMMAGGSRLDRGRCPAGRRRYFDNMNVNEVLANRALQLLGSPPGDYQRVSPLDDIQSAPVDQRHVPTALKVAAIESLKVWSGRLSPCWETFQHKEREMADVLKIGRTELQDAVLTTLGRSMGCFAEAIARDRWRIYKCEERLRVINLGGTAIGTGLGAPRQYIFRAAEAPAADHRLGAGPGRKPGRSHTGMPTCLWRSAGSFGRWLEPFEDRQHCGCSPRGPTRTGRDPLAAAAGRFVDHARQR